MTPERWRQVEDLCRQALDRDASEREVFLRSACGGDDDIRLEVQSLLAKEKAGEEFFAQSAIDHAAKELGADLGGSCIGRDFGCYRVVSLLGAGGMGEVYRAHDTRLKRGVATKILPEEFCRDRDRVSRFQREAIVLASLNHPNIAAIYDVHEAGTSRYIVLELVEGPTLAEMLNRGPLPTRDALKIAIQICEALEAVHEKGISHRDLKPANIKITPDRGVKLLDFGLAKTFTSSVAAAMDADASGLPTATHTGVVLGTAPYMSPEQVEGKRVDKRCDIWAFGAVLYEMLTARRVFEGETISQTLATILSREPDWTALPGDTPAGIGRLLQRCLAKNPERRLHDIADARLEIDEAIHAHEPTDAVPAQSRSRHGWLVIPLVAFLVAIGLASGVLLFRLGPPVEPVAWQRAPVRFLVQPPEDTTFVYANAAMAVSADGRNLAWLGRGRDGVSRIWVRSLDSPDARMLRGTDGATSLFWSPKGASVGFYAQTKLKLIDLATGSIQTLADVPDGSAGATWSNDNVIVFSARLALFSVPAIGGAPKKVAEIDKSRQEDTVRFPQFLPDGHHFLYVARSGRLENSAAYVGTLDGKAIRLFPTLSKVEYVPNGYLLYVTDGTLLARRFDPNTFAVGSETVPVTTGVGAYPNGMDAFFTVSANGVVAYRAADSRQSILRWFDRSGRPLETWGVPARYYAFRLSMDGSSQQLLLTNTPAPSVPGSWTRRIRRECA